MKKDNGITLIALVITIIVMLILVIVTVSFAMNGGLFTQARTASEGYREAQIKEAIAVVKAELYSEYYSQHYSAPTNDQILERVNEYLDGSNLELELTAATVDAEPTSSGLSLAFKTVDSAENIVVPAGGWPMVLDYLVTR